MWKRLLYLLLMGVLMATLMSALFGCGTADKQAIDPIITQLSEKYGKSFTVYALGDRIGKTTATAYVFADDDPTLLFTARVDMEGRLTYEDYAYRTVCRQVETLANEAFAKCGMDTECFAVFTPMSNEIEAGTTPAGYIEANAPDSVVITMIIKAGEQVTGENITQAYLDLHEQLSAIDMGMGFDILSADDYDKLAEAIRMETQVFDTNRLYAHGAADAIQEINIQASNGGLSMSPQEIDAALSKEGT